MKWNDTQTVLLSLLRSVVHKTEGFVPLAQNEEEGMWKTTGFKGFEGFRIFPV